MGPTLDACQQRYQRFCQRYAPEKKARRACLWGSRLFPHGLLKKTHQAFFGQDDLFEEKGCQVTKPDHAESRPEFASLAAAFTTANR